jgi:hypothetical protein
MDSASGKVVSIASAPRTRQLPCWIESFIDETDGIPSPKLFRKWAAITAIGGALERRVYVDTAESAVYANLFVLLVAPPGVGKTMAIRKPVELWQRTQSLKVAPDDLTKASLLDALAASKQIHILDGGKDMLEYHSMQIGADELGVLLPAHDLSVMSVMNKLFDNVDLYKESRRGRDDDLEMRNPQVTLLAGTQPDFLASLLPPEAWGMGFMSRMIMVYQGESPRPNLFGARRKFNVNALVADLKDVCKLHGEMAFTEEAKKELIEWYAGGLKPIPQHLKLKHYNPRRILNVLKLCMISSVSRNSKMLIELCDIDRARSWLLEAETLMPEIFKDMSGKSDRDVIQDLQGFVWQLWVSSGKKPVHKSRIDAFLSNRTPAYNMKVLFDVCVSMKVLINVGPDLYNPGTTNDTGLTE